MIASDSFPTVESYRAPALPEMTGMSSSSSKSCILTMTAVLMTTLNDSASDDRRPQTSDLGPQPAPVRSHGVPHVSLLLRDVGNVDCRNRRPRSAVGCPHLSRPPAARCRFHQPHGQPDRSDEEKWRGIESRSGTRKGYRRDRMPENRSDCVAHCVRKLNEDRQPGQRTHPARAPRGEWRERKTEQEHQDQSHQPLAKRKRRHGKPCPALPHGDDSWIVDVKESGRGLVDDMQREGHC
jgi:hypothetical protein